MHSASEATLRQSLSEVASLRNVSDATGIQSASEAAIRQGTSEAALTCPLPLADYPHVLLAHGGGGKLTHRLIEQLLMPAFTNPALEERHDGAALTVGGVRLAFSTDSYVVRPLFFPGGDIGALAINGTVNDLAMCGARPLYLSAGLIVEEGLAMETLWRVVRSMQSAAAAAGVQLVTGDTKVVDRGKADGLFINTSGIGVIEQGREIAPRRVRAGDVVIVSGDIGRHGIAIMAEREGLAFETTIESDCGPLADLVLALFDAGVEVHCLRDLTRGGLGAATIEIAEDAGVHIDLEESAIPVRDDVQGACELLGLDPLFVANEGRFLAIVAPESAERALAIMRAHPLGVGAAIAGYVTEAGAGYVTMRGRIGVSRIVDMPSGEQLPRIC